MDATNRARWRRVACVSALVCVAAQLCAVAALPAPPDVTGSQVFLDIATPPPITEDELHQMVEHLLMEAYGDEYEPPPSKPKVKNSRETAPRVTSTSSSTGSPGSESATDGDIAETLLILQQQEKLIEIQAQREKLHQMQKQLHEEHRQQQEQQQQMFISSTTTPPFTKGSLILHQQLKQNPKQAPSLVPTQDKPKQAPSLVPTLDKPKVLHGQNSDAANLKLTTRPPVSVQPPETIIPKPRGIPSPGELQKALVFQQENQPGVLIVDRRKKSRTEKSKGARQLLLHHHHNNHQASGSTPITSFTTTPTTTMHHTRTQSKQRVIKRGRSSSTPTPTTLQLSSLINDTRSISVVPTRSSKRETKPVPVEEGNLASRNGRSPQQTSAKPEQKAERKAPVIESAKLLSHIVSEDMRPFQKIQSSTKQMGSGSAPRPFTLPSPVNNPNPVKIQPEQQQNALTVDIADEDLMMLQLLGSQLSQAARVQSTKNLHPAQPHSTQNLHQAQPHNTQNLHQAQPHSNRQASLNNQLGNLQFVMQPRQKNDAKRIVINLGNMANQLQSTHVPPQLDAGSNDNFIGNFRDNSLAKAISSGNTLHDFSSSTQQLHPVNFNSNGRVTVGDLVMSLNGQNGIRVVSLGDLRNNGNIGSSNSDNDAHLLQQLRNAMISGNINSLQNQQLNFGVPLPSLNQGSHGSNVGVPIPTLVNHNQQGSNGVGNGNAGRQFDFLFGDENRNSQNTVNSNGGGNGGSGVINDLLFESSISVGRPGDSIQQSGGAGSLDDFFVNANSGSGGVAVSGAGDLDDIFRSSDSSSTSTGSVGVPLPAASAQDPFPDTFTTTSDTATTGTTGTTVLEDNTDFDFGSYEDDFPDLPPQPPNVFRTGISDIFFTKGQWIGTLLGGLFDVGSAVGSSVSKLFKKGSRETTTAAST